MHISYGRFVMYTVQLYNCREISSLSLFGKQEYHKVFSSIDLNIALHKVSIFYTKKKSLRRK